MKGLEYLELEEQERVSELKKILSDALVKYKGLLFPPEDIGEEEAIQVMAEAWKKQKSNSHDIEYHVKNAGYANEFLKYNRKANQAHRKEYAKKHPIFLEY